MRKLAFPIAAAFLVAHLFSCQHQAVTKVEEVIIGSLKLDKTGGKDCDKSDSLRYDCATVSLSWPNVEQGPAALKKSVNAWAKAYLASILVPEEEGKKPSTTESVDAYATKFLKYQEEFAKEAPESPMANFTAECSYEVFLNDGQYLTIEINGYTYMGGAHGSSTAAVATFEVKTGKQLTWKDLVTDQKATKTLAEKIFRAERTDLFEPADGFEAFEFDGTFPFVLPANFGLVEEGIYCHFVQYEVGPYAIGSTQLLIPFEELGALAKVKVAVPKDAGDIGEVPEFYTMEGDSIVIPPFEIEVSKSLKANQTLSKQKETTVVWAYFFGTPTQSRYGDETGQLPLVQKEIELSGDQRVAKFNGVKFSKKDFKKLAEKEVILLINVYSGRRSSPNNLLDCGILELSASKFRNKRFLLGCKLIPEKIQSNSGIIASYAIPTEGKDLEDKPVLLVSCNEKGEMEYAGESVADFEALKIALHNTLSALIVLGAKELPDIQTDGCMMGASGEIRSLYEELKTGLQKGSK